MIEMATAGSSPDVRLNGVVGSAAIPDGLLMESAQAEAILDWAEVLTGLR